MWFNGWEHTVRDDALAFSRDGSLLASAECRNPIVRIWNVADQKLVRAIELPPKKNEWQIIKSVEFSPDAKRLLIFAHKNVATEIYIYDVATGRMLHQLIDPNSFWGNKAAIFLGDGNALATTNREFPVTFWDAKAGKVVSQMEPKIEKPANFSPKATSSTTTLAASSHSTFFAVSVEWTDYMSPNKSPRTAGFVAIYDWSRSLEIVTLLRFGHTWGRMDFSSDGSLILIGNSSKASVFDTMTGKPAPILQGPSGSVATFSPDGRIHAGYVHDSSDRKVSRPGGIGFWELYTGTLIAVIRDDPVPRDKIINLAYSPTGKTLAAGIFGDSRILLLRAPGPSGIPGQSVVDKGESFDHLWDRLASKEAGEAYPAMVVLAQRGDATADYLRKALKPREFTPPQQVKKWIAKLDAGAFAERDAATKALLAIGMEANGPLRDAVRGDRLSAEGKARAKSLLPQLAKVSRIFCFNPPSDQLQRLRAIQTLEWMASKPAVEILKTMAQGAPAACETQEAQRSLSRLSPGARIPQFALPTTAAEPIESVEKK